MRAGSYSASKTDKGVALLCGAGVVVNGTASAPCLEVSNLPAGATFVAENLRLAPVAVSPLPGTTAMNIANCAGRVHLQRVTRSDALLASRAVWIDNALDVTIADCVLDGGIVCTSATVTITGTSARGTIASVTTYGAPALSAGSARVMLVDCTLRGSDGLFGGSTVRPPNPAVIAGQSSVSIGTTSNAGAMLTAGVLAFPLVPTSALLVNNGAAIVDPRVSLVPSGGGSPIGLTGTGSAATTPLPALIAHGGALGGALSLGFDSPAGDRYYVALGLPIDPVPTLPGLLFLDPVTAIPLAVGVQAPSGLLSLSLTVPNDPLLRGVPIVLQAASEFAASGFLFLTNPSITVLR